MELERALDSARTDSEILAALEALAGVSDLAPSPLDFALMVDDRHDPVIAEIVLCVRHAWQVMAPDEKHAAKAPATQKIATDFGSIYAHVSFDLAGRLAEVSVSTPGKHRETSVDRALRAVGAAVDDIAKHAAR